MEALGLRGLSVGVNLIVRKIYNNMTNQPNFDGRYLSMVFLLFMLFSILNVL